MQHGIGEADTTNHIQATAPSPNQMLTDHADDHNRFDRGVNRGPNQVISKTRAQGKRKRNFFSFTTRPPPTARSDKPGPACTMD